MTTQRLHDLLEELVTDATPVDGIDSAWERAVRTRRRRRLAAVAGTAVAVIALGAAILYRPDSVSTLPITTPSSTPTVTTSSPPPTTGSPLPSSPPDTTYAGAGVWWSPTLAVEADLPWLEDDSPLPREIDLSEGAPDAAGSERAVAAFSVVELESGALRRVVLLAPDGSTRSLDTSRLGPVQDEQGNAGLSPLANGSLAPDGRHLFFVQNSSLELYEPATGSWRTIDTPDWLAEGARWLDADTIWVPAELGGATGTTYGVDGRLISPRTVAEQETVVLGDDAQVYGPVKTGGTGSAQSQVLAGPVEPVPAGNVSNPEAVVVRKGSELFALALHSAGSAPLRSKGCCPVAGLLDANTAVFESSGRLLAWRVGSPDVRRVTEVTGWTLGEEGYGASWAPMWR
jgi:hypothetical protein